MPQTVAVVRNTLTATGGGTTDFTSSGFGTPTAAIIITCNANATNNPQDDASVSVGFWDGTNARVVAVGASDNMATSVTKRGSDDALGAVVGAALNNTYSVSAVTDGIRLTMVADNTSAQRFCTVIMLAGVSAVAGTFTPNATQNGTQASASLGFSPKLIFFVSIGSTTADVSAAAEYVLSFGFAAVDGTHRMIGHASADSVADEAATILYSETRCVGQVAGGALGWAGEVTAFGADTFTMTTRDGATGSDLCFFLALGGADLSFDCGTLTTPTSTGNDVVATDVSPDALLLFLSTAINTTLATDSSANGVTLGLADATNEYSHNAFVQDAAATMNTGSVATATTVLDLDTSSGGARADMCTATVTLNASDFTLNYSAVDGTARKGWWVVFGDAAAPGGLSIPIAAYHYLHHLGSMQS